MLEYLTLQATNPEPTIIASVYAVLLSFVLSNLIAFSYEKTFQGLSYSRNFVQSLILASIVVTIAMQAIGDNIARGIGMFGALTLIRFRSSLKDPKDMIFIFASMAVGIANGVHAYILAVIGSLGFSLAAFVLYRSPFGQDRNFDGVLRFNVVNEPQLQRDVEIILKKYCRKFMLITMQDAAQGTRIDQAFQIKLFKPQGSSSMIAELGKIAKISGINLMMQASHVDL